MKIFKQFFSFIFTISILLLLSFAAFLWWNNYPPLLPSSNPPIIKIKVNNTKEQNSDILKVASYNIHFAIGYNVETLAIDFKSYYKRLNNLAKVLQSIDADVVF